MSALRQRFWNKNKNQFSDVTVTAKSRRWWDFKGKQRWSTGSREGGAAAAAAAAAGIHQWIAKSSSYGTGPANVSCSCEGNALYTEQRLDCPLDNGDFNLEYKEAQHEGIHCNVRL